MLVNYRIEMTGAADRRRFHSRESAVGGAGINAWGEGIHIGDRSIIRHQTRQPRHSQRLLRRRRSEASGLPVHGEQQPRPHISR